MISIHRERAKIYPGTAWGRAEFGKIQVAARSLGSVIGQYRKVIIFVLDEGEDVPDDFKIVPAKQSVINKTCKACGNIWTFKAGEDVPRACLGCGCAFS